MKHFEHLAKGEWLQWARPSSCFVWICLIPQSLNCATGKERTVNLLHKMSILAQNLMFETTGSRWKFENVMKNHLNLYELLIKSYEWFLICLIIGKSFLPVRGRQSDMAPFCGSNHHLPLSLKFRFTQVYFWPFHWIGIDSPSLITRKLG